MRHSACIAAIVRWAASHAARLGSAGAEDQHRQTSAPVVVDTATSSRHTEYTGHHGDPLYKSEQLEMARLLESEVTSPLAASEGYGSG